MSSNSFILLCSRPIDGEIKQLLCLALTEYINFSAVVAAKITG